MLATNYILEKNQKNDQINRLTIIQIMSQKFTRSPQQYIKTLEKYDKINFYKAQQFCNYIVSYIGEDAAEYFTAAIKKLDKLYYQRYKIASYYPVISDQEQNDEQFVKKKIQRFVQQFQREDISLIDEQIQQIENPNFEWGNKVNKQQAEQIQLQKEQINQQGEKNHIAQAQYTFKLKIYKKRQYIDHVPIEYLKTKSLSTLLQLNVTKLFKNQLDQVKELIKNQIFNGKKVIEVYQQFLLEYLQLYYIKQGKCQDYDEKQAQIINQQIKTYFKEMNHQNGEKLKKYWKIIQKKQKKMIHQKQSVDFKEQIKNILLKALQKNIYLTFSYAKKIYGCTHSSSIFININQMNEGLKFETFRSGPLKSYIALTCYHELAHFLIRQTKLCEIRNSGSSFTTKSASVGNRILQQMRRCYKNIPEQFHLANKSQSQSTNERFQQILAIVSQILTKNKHLFQQVAQFKEQLQDIKLVICSFSFVFTKIYRQIQLDQLKDLWKSVYCYIDKLEENINDEEYQYTTQQEVKYRFFFSLFLTEPIAKSWIKKLRENQEEYEFYRKKLNQIRTKRYYIGENQAIDLILSKKIMNRFEQKQNSWQNSFSSKSNYTFKSNQHVLNFINCILFKQYSLQKLNTIIGNICDKINKIELQEYTCNYQSYKNDVFQDKLFKKLQVKNFMQTNKITNLSEYILKKEEKNKICLIFDVEVSCQKFNKILNYLEYLEIASQLPSFFTNIGNIQLRNFQSGYDIQKRLFLKPEIETIYAKDFTLMKEIQQKNIRHLIGTQPQQESQKRLSIMVNRQGCSKKDVGISLKRGYCGNHYNQLMRIQAKKKRMQKLQKYIRNQ